MGLKGCFPLSRIFSVRTQVKFTRVNEKEAMYERPRANVKVEEGSTFTLTRNLPYIVSIVFTCVRTYKITGQWKSTLRQ